MPHPSDLSQQHMTQQSRLAREAIERQAAAVEAIAKLATRIMERTASRPPLLSECGQPSEPFPVFEGAQLDMPPASAHDPAPAVRIVDLPDTLNVRQAALVLGLRPQTIYEWVETKRLPCLRAGRAIRFDKAALLEFRQAQVVSQEPRDRVSINLRRPRRAG